MLHVFYARTTNELFYTINFCDYNLYKIDAPRTLARGASILCHQTWLVQLYILVCVADLREVALELLARDNHREAVVVGVEAQRGLLA